jgi:hypothetical protein
MGIPGVGEITALSFKASVDDPTRFKRSRTVGAHFGSDAIFNDRFGPTSVVVLMRHKRPFHERVLTLS